MSDQGNIYTNFFNAISGINKPVGKSVKNIVEQDKLMNEQVPLKRKKEVKAL